MQREWDYGVSSFEVRDRQRFVGPWNRTKALVKNPVKACGMCDIFLSCFPMEQWLQSLKINLDESGEISSSLFTVFMFCSEEVFMLALGCT